MFSFFSDNRNIALKEFERFSLQDDNAVFIDIAEDEKAVRTVEEGRAHLAAYLRNQSQGMDVDQIKTDRQKQIEVIRYLRTNAGLSQRVIASILGIDKGGLERIKPE